ncbi:SUMF1/EgtB/PvdO family nonheme iron enzyme [Bacteroides sp. 51]|uniref:SUMF1/EgtB/PvdO family nonheme iron enzyme n=1 Tax=Bacteroides sp. 51 TaxID=2302938 RepID=UPI0013D56F63|nr:SUMF1/EgtB/PvdO family nonheme iron enzyme [Bacteroides sp. 51]NDV84354.1 hypothetical protein [Bacteroides sp. 51]
MKNIYQNTSIALIFLLAAILPTSCTESELVAGHPNTSVLVELSAQIGPDKTDSRALTRVVGNQWEMNDMVGIYMVSDNGVIPADIIKDSNNKPYDNMRYKVAPGTGSSGFKLIPAAQADAMYYPENGNTVNFISYFPYRSDITGYTYPLNIKKQNADALYSFLYSTKAMGTGINTGSINSANGHMTFKHQLSKLVVKLKPKQSTLDLSSMIAKVTDLPVTADFSLIDGSFSNRVSGNIDLTGNRQEALDNGDGTTTILTCFDFVFIPHAGMANRKLNFYTATKNYHWTLPDNLEFTGGNEYTATFEVDGDKLVSSGVTITPWGDVSETLSIPTVKIPAGKYWMGSPDGQTEITFEGRTFTPDADPLRSGTREGPMHEVTISKDFYMSKYEITNAQYCVFLNANLDKFTSSATDVKATLTGVDRFNQTYDYTDVPLLTASATTVAYDNGKWSPVSGYENHPICQVSWYGAFAFCDWVGGRLPTEAEWEYACRGGEYFRGTTPYCWISFDQKTLNDYAWYGVNNTPETGDGYPTGTKPVGLKMPNAWGLYDISGNVWEWCYDWFFGYTSSAETDPVKNDNLGSTTTHVLRGGAFGYNVGQCRIAMRGANVPEICHPVHGFRPVFPID